VFTTDGGWRRGQVVPLKENVDKAIDGSTVERVIVFKRCGNPVEKLESVLACRTVDLCKRG